MVRETETGRYNASPESFAEVARFLETPGSDAAGHEALFFEAEPESGALFGAFLHRTARGQGQGGLRHWPYARFEDFLRDGLRLSLGMTRKNAAAGLWWGGGKGIIAPGEGTPAPEARRALYRAYGRFVTSLCGCYVTAEDVGTTPVDMAEVHRATRFATCVPPEVGGSGNPSLRTAVGVVCGMQAALEFGGQRGLAGLEVAMQGTGNVGSAMIPLLLERGVARVVASEISAERRAVLLDRFAGEPVEVRLAASGDDAILCEPCDILAPSALGGVLGSESIPGIQASLVCGPANNQLVDEQRDGGLLLARGITHVPDYIVNRMGIVQCANEQYGYVSRDDAVERHLSTAWSGGIHQTTLRILGHARDTGITPIEAANRLADERAAEPHPIFGDRARAIVDSLVAGGWQRRV